MTEVTILTVAKLWSIQVEVSFPRDILSEPLVSLLGEIFLRVGVNFHCNQGWPSALSCAGSCVARLTRDRCPMLKLPCSIMWVWVARLWLPSTS